MKTGLAPTPQMLVIEEGQFTATQPRLISINQRILYPEAQRARSMLAVFGGEWDIALTTQPAGVLRLSCGVDFMLTQSYTLAVTPDAIIINGSDAAGVFYGLCTLSQLLQLYGTALPCLNIIDFPEIERRGVMLDISRDRVPTLATLLELVEQLATWKINELQLYTEHTFAYRAHPLVWQDASPLTSADLLILRQYCAERHIDLVPNLNALGHMERWLKHTPYRPLAEMPDGFPSLWHDDGRILPPSTLNPTDPRSLDLVRGMIDELLPHFSSRYVNVGGDEPWELGKGASRAAWEQEPGRLYLEYLRALHDEAVRHERVMLFWADIIVHYPRLVPQLPHDAIAMVWGYEADEPKESDAALISASGLETYMVPGTSSWNSIAGRTTNALSNLSNAAALALKYGSRGYLITDWGDNGHWQPLSVSYAGFLYGACVAWSYDKSHDMDLAAALDRYAFHDRAGRMGRIALEMGNLYTHLPLQLGNGTLLFYLLQLNDSDLRAKLQPEDNTPALRQSLQTISRVLDELLEALDETELQVDQERVLAEYRQAGALLRLAVARARHVLGEGEMPAPAHIAQVIEQQRVIWLARHRPGGLSDSLRRLNWLCESS